MTVDEWKSGAKSLLIQGPIFLAICAAVIVFFDPIPLKLIAAFLSGAITMAWLELLWEYLRMTE